MSAYCVGDYEQAMEHALAGYQGFEQANHRWGMTAALCRLGFAAARRSDASTRLKSICGARWSSRGRCRPRHFSCTH
jgi:hypothetical protein